jgi:hypothetical protein
MRYVVKAKEEGDALDEVAFQEEDPNFNEFSQKYLGSTILGTRELADNEVIELCDIDNDYVLDWPTEKKLEVFTNIIEYNEN